MFRDTLSAENTIVLFEAFHGIALHAHAINVDDELRSRLIDLGPMTQMQDPPLLRLENESYNICLSLLQNVVDGETKTAGLLADLCAEILRVYVDVAKIGRPAASAGKQVRPLWQIPTGSSKRRELSARGPIVVAALHVISEMETNSFNMKLVQFFPLLSGLISCQHGSNEVQEGLSDMLGLKVGPVVLQACSGL